MTTLSLIPFAPSAVLRASVASCARVARQALRTTLAILADYRAARRQISVWDGDGYLPAARPALGK
jgi:hypothetical protein